MNNPITPLFYQVIDFHILPHSIYDISKSVGDIALVTFAYGDLSDPASDPIAMYFEGGTRKYLWKGSTFGEYAINPRVTHRLLMADGSISKKTAAAVELTLIKYQTLYPPSTYHEPSADLEYVRAIWKINKGNLR